MIFANSLHGESRSHIDEGELNNKPKISSAPLSPFALVSDICPLYFFSSCVTHLNLVGSNLDPVIDNLLQPLGVKIANAKHCHSFILLENLKAADVLWIIILTVQSHQVSIDFCQTPDLL